ncbi:uncharacterized protein LOC128231015 [Mya arenaria]|uniref:uncharacterized protein LOC128231015 n=1 Tax=Mya arenaria TaxID=6604 RepID=UPI0022E7984D|nr:uncharacterized protein LOC128231015 [Mya arenaria]
MTCILGAGQTDCSMLADGLYNIGCKVYEECKNHVLISHECQEQMVFNNVTNKCDHENHVAAPCGLTRDCSKKGDGSYVDLTLNCTSYYTCSHHIYYGHNFCTPGTVFEQSMGTCVWPVDAYVPCGTKT